VIDKDGELLMAWRARSVDSPPLAQQLAARRPATTACSIARPSNPADASARGRTSNLADRGGRAAQRVEWAILAARRCYEITGFRLSLRREAHCFSMPSENYIPPRFWWLKRIVAAFGLLALTVTAARLFWGCYADRQLQTAIAAYAASGEPFWPEDFPVSSPSDPPGGLELLDRATKYVQAQTPIYVSDLILLRQDGAQWPEWEQWLRRYLEAQASVLSLAHDARMSPRALFRAPPKYGGLGWLSIRPVAASCCVAAWVEHGWWKDDEALRHLRDAVAVAREQLWRRPSAMGPILESFIMREVFETLEEITPGLKVATEGDTCASPPKRAAREEALGLLQDLSDEGSLRTSWVLAMQGGRAAVADAMRQCSLAGSLQPISSVALGPTPASLLVCADSLLRGPAYKLRAVELMRYYSACSKSGARLIDARGCPEPFYAPVFPGFLEILGKSTTRYLDPIADLRKELALRRMMACALAVRLYQVDHGTRPPGLATLVPTYLRAVPIDPFAPDNRPLGYRPDSEQPLLYSIGEDGLDEGGSHILHDNEPLRPVAGDRVLFLNGDRQHAAVQLPDGPAPLPGFE
jgi:hypothetical protein